MASARVEDFERFPGATEVHKCNAAVDARFEVMLIDGERLVEGCKRFLGAAEVHQRNAVTDERFAAVPLCGNRLVVNGKRCLMPIESVEHCAEGAQ